VVMPLKSLVGVQKAAPTIGSVPTHGEEAGVKKVSSESSKEIVVLTKLPTVALLTLLQVLMNSFNDYLGISLQH